MSLIGKEVSDFTAQAFVDGEFKTVTKADLKGKWSIFFFYPADFTFVCPARWTPGAKTLKPGIDLVGAL